MLAWLGLHIAIGGIGTWLARRYALHRKLIDLPGERRSHDVPTPRGGGIAIVVSLLVAVSVLAWRHPGHIVLLGSYALGMILVAGVGLMDDHRPLSPWLRLGVQAAAAGVLAIGVAGTWGDLPLALAAFVAAMVLTNIWNFMDGINGIAASQAALVGGGLMAAVGNVWGWLALALVASCVGFLPFNFPRARIFLGDVGSGALGFTLATLSVMFIGQTGLAGSLLLLPLSAFLVDSGLTLLRRAIRGERWWTPHSQHAYQRWAARRGGHTFVTLAYAGWTAVGLLVAYTLRGAGSGSMLVAVAAWIGCTAAAWGWLQHAAGPGALNGSEQREMEKVKE